MCVNRPVSHAVISVQHRCGVNSRRFIQYFEDSGLLGGEALDCSALECQESTSYWNLGNHPPKHRHVLECLNPQQRPFENFRVSRPIFSLKVGLFSCSKNSSFDPQVRDNLPLWCCGRKRSYLPVTSFLGFAKKEKKKIYVKTGNEKNSELFLRFWPQTGRGNRLCSFMFAEGTMRATNTWHSHFIVMRRSWLYLYSTLHPASGVVAVRICRTVQKAYTKEY